VQQLLLLLLLLLLVVVVVVVVAAAAVQCHSWQEACGVVCCRVRCWSCQGVLMN
jgi:hypothetical protein